MKSQEIEKNIRDLEHSESLAKAGTFLALAFSFSVSIFFGLKEFQDDMIFALFVAIFVFILFLSQSMRCFINCKNIRTLINNMIKK
jgi:hypothetical protein